MHGEVFAGGGAAGLEEGAPEHRRPAGVWFRVLRISCCLQNLPRDCNDPLQRCGGHCEVSPANVALEL
jgi:hypothetical protein